jgi:hypothetical protein
VKRINPLVDLHINAFSGAAITELETGITNGIIRSKEINGKRQEYVTQRPAIDVFEDASDQGAGARGRAIHYWDDNSALYIFNIRATAFHRHRPLALKNARFWKSARN